MIDSTKAVNIPPQGTHASDGFRSGQFFAGSGSISIDADTGALTYNNVPWGYTQGAPGGPMSTRFTYRIAPQVATTTCISNKGSSTSGSSYLPLSAVSPYTYAAIIGGKNVVALDVPRTLYFTRASNSTSANVYIFAYDCGNILYTEQVTLPSGSGSTGLTATSKRAAKYVLAIYVSTTDTWVVGTGAANGASTFGLPFYVQTYGDIYAVYNNAPITYSSSNFIAGDTTNPATILTGDPRGTVTFTPVSSGILTVDMYVQGANNPSVNPNPSLLNNTLPNLTVGVPQFSQPLF